MSFITFEGIDGCGKSTNAGIVASSMQENGKDVVFTKEPGAPDSKICVQLREIALNPDSNLDKDTAELFIMMADRAQHVNEIIVPALHSNKEVISDRYIDSTIAYQGFGRRRGVDLGMIESFNKVACCGVIPDLTIIFDIDVKLAMSRTTKSEFGKHDVFEKEDIEFHKRVASGFEYVYNNRFKNNRHVEKVKVTEDMNENDVFAEVKAVLDTYKLW